MLMKYSIVLYENYMRICVMISSLQGYFQKEMDVQTSRDMKLWKLVPVCRFLLPHGSF